MIKNRRLSNTAIVLLVLCCQPPWAQSAERAAVLIDTDLGTEIDDAFALALALGSDELDVRGLTSVGADATQRAMMLCRFLTATGRRHTAVAVGADPQPQRRITDQFAYYNHPDVLFDRTKKPEKHSASEFWASRIKAADRVTLIALGPLTNVARFLSEDPKSLANVKRVIALESNIRFDIPAARQVFAAGLPIVLLSEKACRGLALDERQVEAVFSPRSPLTRQVEALYQMAGCPRPPLAEALAVALCVDERFVATEYKPVEIDETGVLRDSGARQVRLITATKAGEFKAWYVKRMASLVPPARKPVQLVAKGGRPNRVHVAEDFDSDIERRWWMSGQPETDRLPPGSKRACRSVLTHDFDDLLMVSREMYSAVIFNPVPGPPMGKNTRLSFRYWLKGADTLRVQIYSLTNGYHRQLVVKGLPQQQWQEATVDMTAARRADGTGGPLGEGERIDDIQFYVDPDAEILVDDVVLYDAAPADEQRQFPKRILFTAWFDTGTQGREWPGDFTVVNEAGNYWRAARSVASRDTGKPWIRLGFRGQRALGRQTAVAFRYRLSGPNAVELRLVNSSTGQSANAIAQSLLQDKWTETEVTFDTAAMQSADEIQWLLSPESELLIDDVLVFEPQSDARNR